MKERIERLKGKWFLMEPVFFSILITHAIEFDSKLECLVATGSGKIRINPERASELTDTMLEEILKAECLRIILRHPYQRCQDDRDAMYTASNIVVAENTDFKEYILKNAREELGNFVRRKDSLEYYYEFIEKKKNREKGKNGKGDEQEDSGIGSGTDSGGGDSDSSPESLAATQFWGEDDFQMAEIDALIDRLKETSQWGSIPEDIQEQIEAAAIPKTNYRDIIKRFCASVIASERSRTRMKPNRRFGYSAMGSRRDFTTKLLVAIDTSGSITDKYIAKAVGVINGLFKYGVEEIDYSYFDVELHPAEDKVRRKKLKKVTAVGRGGTDFNCIFKFMSEHREYDGVIIITDGFACEPDCSWKKKIGRQKVLWCLNNKENFTIFAENKSFKEFGSITFIS